MQLEAIGYFHTEMQLKFDSPHQPDLASAGDGGRGNYIELSSGLGFERALKDLAGFERIWVISCFHLNKTWRPMVLPPRGPPRRRGLFATRSPHRPNPIGLSAVTLLGVDGLKLRVGSCDLVDGTPILDIKPYIPTNDAFPAAKFGWVEELEREYAKPPGYFVELSELAREQLLWLQREWGVDFISRARELLARDPQPHRTRRIKLLDSGVYRMGCGAWRIYFSLDQTRVLVQSVAPGYPMRTLLDKSLDRVPFREAQIAFAKLWSGGEDV